MPFRVHVKLIQINWAIASGLDTWTVPRPRDLAKAERVHFKGFNSKLKTYIYDYIYYYHNIYQYYYVYLFQNERSKYLKCYSHPDHVLNVSGLE